MVDKSMFSGVSSAKRGFDANYLREGHLLCLIDRVKVDKNRKQEPFVAVEQTVLHVFADHPSAHRVGENVTDMMKQASDYFLGDMNAFVGNVAGIPANQVTDQHCVDVTDPMRQIFKGLVVEIKCRLKPTKKGPTNENPEGKFTKVTYVREVRPSEYANILDAKVVETYFPGDSLKKLIEAE